MSLIVFFGDGNSRTSIGSDLQGITKTLVTAFQKTGAEGEFVARTPEIRFAAFRGSFAWQHRSSV